MLAYLIGFGQAVRIGDILCTDGSTVRPGQFAASGKTADGIVFFVDGNNKEGWAVSLECQSVNTHWVTSEHYGETYDIPLLENFELSREAIYDLDGYSNTAIIRNAHGADWYPAAWCVDFNHGWYLPAAGQMRWLIAYMNEINASLAVVNGTMFVYDQPRWYWTSTERTGAHAVVLSQTGSVGNYPKWNYIGEYDIGVRAVKTFTFQTQSHHIGEVVTTPDGQRGVVFYTSPEDDSYWLVAMNDISGTYKWGPATDIADLINYNPNDQFVALHGVHCGYDATASMREAIGTASQYAASNVEFANGWHIPSVGQLSKLYAALPFIESVLANNGGTTLSGHYYWSSTESSSDKAWAINFGENLYTEGFLKDQSKSSSLPLRPVWSESCKACETVEVDIDTSACNTFTFNGTTYVESGDYIHEFITDAGCDSVITLHLTFTNHLEAIPEIIGLTEVNVSTDLIVGHYYYHIDPVPLATHYEWALEGADWIMDTTGTHCSLLITTPGSAILRVRAWNDCGETEQEIAIHGGFFDVDERQGVPVVLYPNPASDKVIVEAEGIMSVKVYNMQGQLLKTWDGEASNRVEISLQNIVAGMYAVEVLTERGSIVSKMTVTHKE